MLFFTNRETVAQGGEGAFTRRFVPGGTRLALARVRRDGGGWRVADLDGDVDDNDALRALVPLFDGPRPVLVYLHGNANPPAACFERCHLLESLYDVEVIGFSWPSEGFLSDGSELPGLAASAVPDDEAALAAVGDRNRRDAGSQRRVRRYRQAKTNAQDSVDALARFLRMLGTARLFVNRQPFTLAVHSLGVHYLQHTIEVPGAAESLGTAHNIALLAACARAAGHREWIAKLHPKGQVFVTYHRADTVLEAARLADGKQTKLGADPGGDRLALPHMRYVDVTGGPAGLLAHSYFAQDPMPKKMKRPFQRYFASGRDIAPGEAPRKVYPAGCDADGLTCFFATQEIIDE